MTKDQIITISNSLAEVYNIPKLLLLACGIAESNLNSLARRPIDPAQDQIKWPDVSGGVWQQTVRWSVEYKQLGFTGAYPGPEITERILKLYYNPEHAGRVAAGQLRYYWHNGNGDTLDTLCRYNKPNRPPSDNPNRANYQRGIDEAAKLLSASDPFQQVANDRGLELIGPTMTSDNDNKAIQFYDPKHQVWGILLQEVGSDRILFTYRYDKHLDFNF